MVKKLIINMECDKNKMSKFKNPTRVPAVIGKDAPKAFRDRFALRYNTLDKKVSGIVGCFGSHIKALNRIVKENLKNVLILEDDSSDIKSIPKDLQNFPHAVYVGGWMVKPKIKDISEPVNKRGFKKGVNKIDYNKFRILETRGYFVPNKQEAKRMLEIIQDQMQMLKII